MEIEEIYREVAPKLQSYLTGNGCSYATACDIVQETFLRLWKRREELSDDLHQVSGLVFTIARNYRNDLARKAQHETLGGETSEDGDGLVATNGPQDESRPGEEAEETAALKRRLKSSLGRMPVQLLETFALSRLGTLSVKDIASGTETSEANVKVRVHRARELFRACFSEQGRSEGGGESGESESAVLKAMMMLAAVDGEISKEELSLYRKFAKASAEQWERSVRAMAYIGFLTEMLEPEEIVREYVREAGEIPSRFIAALEQMASADGDYSRIERNCISALAKKG